MSRPRLLERTSPNVPTRETLLRTIDEETYRQVRDLAVRVDGSRVQVSGVSESFYVKQLVTRAVQSAAPKARLSNDVLVARG